MPEAPDLEVISEILNRRVVGREVTRASTPKPTVLRCLAAPDFASDLPGRVIEGVRRQGKFLVLSLSGGPMLIINPMLVGALQICAASERVAKRTCLVLGLEDELDLRYLDERQMGRVYYVLPEQLDQVPRLDEGAVDVMDGDISYEDFKARLRPFHGEIKGILTRGAFLAGVGNAYSDEILFDAGVFPFRKRRTLDDDELKRLHLSASRVVKNAVVVLRERMGQETHHKIRDFLQVHNKGGQPCPRCGNRISQLTANQRITSFCRHCQPGMLHRN